jgi:hypothetical protein
MTNIKRERGSWTARSGLTRTRWIGASRARIDNDGCLTMTLRLGAGQHHDLVLEVSDRPINGHLARPDEMPQATEEGWSTAVPPCDHRRPDPRSTVCSPRVYRVRTLRRHPGESRWQRGERPDHRQEPANTAKEWQRGSPTSLPALEGRLRPRAAMAVPMTTCQSPRCWNGERRLVPKAARP